MPLVNESSRAKQAGARVEPMHIGVTGILVKTGRSREPTLVVA